MAKVENPIFTQELREPIPSGTPGETIGELTFRKPTGGDIMRCGNPVKFAPYDENREVSFNDASMMKMIATLSGVLQPLVERMDPNDYIECAWGLAPFFIPGMRTASRPQST